ncbi:MAG: hypothetical protein HWE34_11930 [Methylocystaceae bacterium]|nr:hypothetical protein [Methylocystaceae bacterium]
MKSSIFLAKAMFGLYVLLSMIAIPISFLRAQTVPDTEQTLEFLNSFCVKNQLSVANNKLTSQSITLVPIGGDELYNTEARDVSLDLKKVVKGTISYQLIFTLNGPSSKKFDSYTLRCKIQDCAHFVAGDTKTPKTSNEVSYIALPETDQDSCIRAFQHLAGLNGAKDLENFFKK